HHGGDPGAQRKTVWRNAVRAVFIVDAADVATPEVVGVNVDDAGSYVQPRGIDHLHGEVWIDVFGNPCNPAFRTVYRVLSGDCQAVRLATGTAAARLGWLGRPRGGAPVV